MELEKLTPTVEKANEFLGISRALADGDRFREEPTASTREVGISDGILAAALRELETAKLIVGTLEGRKRKYSTLAPPQPIYPLRGLRGSQSG